MYKFMARQFAWLNQFNLEPRVLVLKPSYPCMQTAVQEYYEPGENNNQI